MPKQKFDAVVEAVHYTPDKKVMWVRVYERRGPTFSDRVLLDRNTLVERLKAGKKIFAGQRVQYLASTFNLAEQLHLVQSQGTEVVVAGNASPNHDHLEGVPVL